MQRLWSVGSDYICRTKVDDYLPKQLALISANQMDYAIPAFFARLPGDGPWPDALPADFPQPALRMPDDGFAPDFFEWGKWLLVSRRLREAMALPEWAVSYLPARIVQGSEAARQQEYAVMYVRAFADAIDFEASDCVVEKRLSAKTGNPYLSVSQIAVMRFKKWLQPPCDLFIDHTALIELLATDALAERVLKAGCGGIQFRHPLWISHPLGDYVIRTADGCGRVLWDEAGEEYEIVPFDLAEADRGMPVEPFRFFGDK